MGRRYRKDKGIGVNIVKYILYFKTLSFEHPAL